MNSVSELAITGVSSDALHAIAHELRQPLGAIESIAFYLGLILPREDDKIQEQLSRLQQLVDQSNWILSSGLHMADETPLAPVMMDVRELITQVVSARGPGGESGVRLDLAADLPPVRLDRARGRILIENLLTLFSHLSAGVHPVRITATATETAGVMIDVETPSPGFRSEAQLGCGSALSLASARRTVAAHAGLLDVSVSPASGIRVRVMLP